MAAKSGGGGGCASGEIRVYANLLWPLRATRPIPIYQYPSNLTNYGHPASPPPDHLLDQAIVYFAPLVNRCHGNSNEFEGWRWPISREYRCCAMLHRYEIQIPGNFGERFIVAYGMDIWFVWGPCEKSLNRDTIRSKGNIIVRNLTKRRGRRRRRNLLFSIESTN